VNGNNYDLSNLANAVGNADQQIQDAKGNTYFYRPCNPLQQQGCATDSDPNPAVCQKDTRAQPEFHDCGSFTAVTWVSRGTGLENLGFVITFAGGEEGRQSDVEFICDPTAGTGGLATKIPTENPTHVYHLAWTTQYACPGGGPKKKVAVRG